MYTYMIVLAILQEKHTTQTNGSCVADTDIIHVTILNKKQIRSILLARILPKRINAHVYMV